MKKHIVCFGDSNTHGYCAEPADCSDGGDRFNEEERWTALIQDQLGGQYQIIEEGLPGRTTVFDDPLHESMSGLDSIYAVLMSNEPVDMLILMLGTNDTKERFGVNAACIAIGMERLVCKAQTTPCWGTKPPNILIIAPPHIDKRMEDTDVGFPMGRGCAEKSKALAGYYQQIAQRTGCHFLDAEGLATYNSVDYMHLSAAGHRQLAEALTSRIPHLLSGNAAHYEKSILGR